MKDFAPILLIGGIGLVAYHFFAPEGAVTATPEGALPSSTGFTPDTEVRPGSNDSGRIRLTSQPNDGSAQALQFQAEIAEGARTNLNFDTLMNRAMQKYGTIPASWVQYAKVAWAQNLQQQNPGTQPPSAVPAIQSLASRLIGAAGTASATVDEWNWYYQNAIDNGREQPGPELFLPEGVDRLAPMAVTDYIRFRGLNGVRRYR